MVCCWVTERENKVEKRREREWRWWRYCIQMAFFMHLNVVFSRPFCHAHISITLAIWPFLFDLYVFICHQIFIALCSGTRSFYQPTHTYTVGGGLRGSSTSIRLVYIDWSIQTRVWERDGGGWGILMHFSCRLETLHFSHNVLPTLTSLQSNDINNPTFIKK